MQLTTFSNQSECGIIFYETIRKVFILLPYYEFTCECSKISICHHNLVVSTYAIYSVYMVLYNIILR